MATAEEISEATLYGWRKAARAAGRMVPKNAPAPAGWTSVDTFAAMVETAALNEMELVAYSRHRRMDPAQLQGWRQAREQANGWDPSQARRLHEPRKADQHQIK